MSTRGDRSDSVSVLSIQSSRFWLCVFCLPSALNDGLKTIKAALLGIRRNLQCKHVGDPT
jgi:hypothetical protein